MISFLEDIECRGCTCHLFLLDVDLHSDNFFPATAALDEDSDGVSAKRATSARSDAKKKPTAVKKATSKSRSADKAEESHGENAAESDADMESGKQ
jgi:hypothetical protein